MGRSTFNAFALPSLLLVATLCLVACSPDSDDANNNVNNTDGTTPNTSSTSSPKGQTDVAKQPPLETIKLRVSKETTFFEGPLLEDGSVDFFAAFNAANSEGVTPDNNAFCLIVQAYGPSALRAQTREAIQRKAGMKPLPLEGDYYLDLYAYVESIASPEDFKEQIQEFKIPGRKEPIRFPFRPAVDDANDQMRQAMENPWRVEQYPQIAAWIQRNEKHLETFKQATLRPRLYVPTVALPGEPDVFQITDFSASWGTIESREVAFILLARAMMRLHYGEHAKAWDDIKAVYRWSSLLAQSPGLIEILKAISMRMYARATTLRYITTEGVSADQLSQCASDFQSIPALPTVHHAIHLGERTTGLAATMFIWNDVLNKPELEKMREPIRMFLDINAVLIRLNKTYDQLAEFQSERKYLVRERIEKEYWRDYKTRRKNSKIKNNDPRAWLTFPEGATPQDMRDQMTTGLGDVIEFTVLPGMGAAARTRERGDIAHQLVGVAISLERYRVDNGQYPDKLDAVIPKYRKFLPVDPYSADENVIRYRRTSDGYRLYAVGENGVDEEGRSEGFGNEDVNDDNALIIPIPEDD